MKKRIIRLSLVLALMLCLSVSVFAESQLWHITDDAGILTESQNIELETYAENHLSGLWRRRLRRHRRQLRRLLRQRL